MTEPSTGLVNPPESWELSEEPMGRRMPQYRKPAFELVEQRELLSLVTNIMAGNRQALIGSLKLRSALAQSSGPATQTSTTTTPVSARGGTNQRFVPSTTSIASPQNQGPQGINLVISPIGKLTPHELKKELFQATFVGPYTIGSGRFDSEAFQVFIRGAGRATTMLHCDIQMRLVVAKDPTIQNSGATVIFDRNLNSNTALGFDLAGPHDSVDNRGRPSSFNSVTLDVNTSAGAYVEGFSQGVMDIKYIPSGKRARGVLEQGTAIVKIRGQIYAPNVAFILRNADINP
jgi:hypothetical protein